MGGINYQHLYELQDQVLPIVFQTEREFYLTGGTCLNRFYHEKRYSDDLDFFTNQSPRYRFAIRNIKMALQQEFEVESVIEDKCFTRFKINQSLQIDFVNDVGSTYKNVILLENHYLIDHVENILSNKLTAILGRDNPKDVFDIYLIAKYYSFSWKEILHSAHDKMQFSNDDLVIKLKSFPQQLLNKLDLVDVHFLENFEEHFSKIIDEINHLKVHQSFISS